MAERLNQMLYILPEVNSIPNGIELLRVHVSKKEISIDLGIKEQNLNLNHIKTRFEKAFLITSESRKKIPLANFKSTLTENEDWCFVQVTFGQIRQPISQFDLILREERMLRDQNVLGINLEKSSEKIFF